MLRENDSSVHLKLTILRIQSKYRFIDFRIAELCPILNSIDLSFCALITDLSIAKLAGLTPRMVVLNRQDDCETFDFHILLAILVRSVPFDHHMFRMLCRLEPAGALQMHSAHRRRLARASTVESISHIFEYQVRAVRIAKTRWTT
jgi:hypothetical protein